MATLHRYYRIAILAVLTPIFVAMHSLPASADCAAPTEDTYRKADAIIHAIPTNITTDVSGTSRVTLRVIKSYAGEVGPRVVVRQTPSSISVNFDFNRQYLAVLSVDGDGYYTTNACTGTREFGAGPSQQEQVWIALAARDNPGKIVGVDPRTRTLSAVVAVGLITFYVWRHRRVLG